MVTITELNRAPAIDATTLAIAESLTDPGGRTHTTELAQTSDNVEQFNTSGTQGTVPVSQGDGSLAMEPPEPPSTFSDTEPPVGDAGTFWTQVQNGWSFATGDVITSGIAVDSGTVYVGSDDNNVYAIDAATGGEEWSFVAGGSVESGIAVDSGTVYAGSDDNNVYGLTQIGGIPNTRVVLRASDGQTWRQTL